MIHGIILFKNGQKIDIECDSFKTSISKMTGKIVGIEFVGSGSIEPFFIDLDEVIAVLKAEVK